MIYEPYIEVRENYSISRSYLEAEVIQDSTVLFLKFDGTAGSNVFTDSARYHLNGTASGGAVITGSVKKIGQGSGDFNGTSSYVTTGYNSALNLSGDLFTIEFWVNVKSVTGTQTIVQRGHSTAYGSFKINRWNNNIVLYMSSNGTVWDVANGLNFGAVSIDTWHHIVVTREASGNIVGYRNGVLKFDIATPPPLVDTTQGVILGGYTSFFFAGRIDEFQIIKAAKYTGAFVPFLGAEIVEEMVTRENYNPVHLIDGEIDKIINENAVHDEFILNTHAVIMEENASFNDTIDHVIYDSKTMLYSDFGWLKPNAQGNLRFVDDTGRHEIVSYNTSTVGVLGSSPVGIGYGSASPNGSFRTADNIGMLWAMKSHATNYHLHQSIIIPATSNSLRFKNEDWTIETWIRWGDSRLPASFNNNPPTQPYMGHVLGFNARQQGQTAASVGAYGRSWLTYGPLSIIIYGMSTGMQLFMSSTGTSWNLASAKDAGSLLRTGGSLTVMADVNQWRYLQISRQGTNVRVFLDGVLKSTTAIGATTVLWDPTTFNVQSFFMLGGLNYYLEPVLDFTGFKITKGEALVTAAYNFKQVTHKNRIVSRDTLSAETLASGGGYKHFATIDERAVTMSDTTVPYLGTWTNIYNPVDLNESCRTHDNTSGKHNDWNHVLDIPFTGPHGSTIIKTERGSLLTPFGTAALDTTRFPAQASVDSCLSLGSNGYVTLANRTAGSGQGAEELHWNGDITEPGSIYNNCAWYLEFWFYPTTSGVLQWLFSMNVESTTTYLRAYLSASNQLVFEHGHTGEGTHTFTYTPAPTWNTWNHFVYGKYRTYPPDGNYPATGSHYYINGKVSSYMQLTQAWWENYGFRHATSPLYIGTKDGTTASANRFKGYISRFRVRTQPDAADNRVLMNELGVGKDHYIGMERLTPFNIQLNNRAKATDSISGSGGWVVNKYFTNTAVTSDEYKRGFTRFGDAANADVVCTEDTDGELNQFYGEASPGEDTAATSDTVAADTSIYGRAQTEDSITDEDTLRQVNVSPTNLPESSAVTSDSYLPGVTNFESITDNNSVTDDFYLAGKSTFPAVAETASTTTPPSGRSYGYPDRYRTINESAAAIEAQILNTHVIYAGANHFQYDILKSVYLEDAWFSNRIGVVSLFNTMQLTNHFVATMHVMKTINRTAYSFENSLIKRVDLSTKLQYELKIGDTITASKKFWNNLLIAESPIFTAGNVVRLQYEYRIILDGTQDVTDKVKSCTISYGIDKYCGEIDIAWADYTVYDMVDCSNIERNYMNERLTVYTKMVGVTDWVFQGSFFVEKRSINVVAGSIEVSSWGRSKPALLSMPYALPLTKTWHADTTAKTIALDVIGGTVPLEWGILDYLILGGNFSAESEQPIDVVSKLIAPVKGIFSADRSGILKVIYRYKDI